MAIFADVAGLDVCRGLAGCLRTVMAAEAIARNIDVIKVRGEPAGSGMAVIAIVATGDVRGMLAGGRDAVVARAAGANDLCVIYREYWSKNISRMAVLTHIAGLDMRDRFAGCLDTIVAAEAVINDADVVEVSGPPGIGRVAVITGIAAVDMCGVLAGGRDAVVARAAGTDDLGMVNGKNGPKHVGVVAVLADVCGLNVRRALAGCLDTVVAINTVAGNVYMIEICR